MSDGIKLDFKVHFTTGNYGSAPCMLAKSQSRYPSLPAAFPG